MKITPAFERHLVAFQSVVDDDIERALTVQGRAKSDQMMALIRDRCEAQGIERGDSAAILASIIAVHQVSEESGLEIPGVLVGLWRHCVEAATPGKDGSAT